ncbi:beta keto-acyl synthase [Parafrankia soli]|uniref:Beta keto-acyl synthase n=2 Tax=Parafrankia soli TaxID=2599596 RepID=A0A1S1Q772_9ACTN|nr:type I polyketide synthase [Parafrankia soli]OHV28962.1 beta keto-acyl synthase [Parafrankia soli]
MSESGPPRRLADTPIAIVGMAGLFPHAHDFREFWQNIVDARDCIEDIPASRWNIDDYYDTDPTVPDRTYSRRGGFVPDVAFDPLEFGLPPNQLEVTSTLQTLSLVVARDLLRDAGAHSAHFADGADWYDADSTGVVLGVTGPVPLMHPLAARLTTPVLREVVRACGLTEDDAQAIATRYAEAFAPWEENSFPGLLANVTAGRIANRLGLGGMNSTVDAACAASLSAVRMAIAELVDGRADMMIAGGADTENSIFGYMCFSKTQALSKSDRIRPFDEGADGTLIGEGIGMLALRRLADAERDGNRIYAVIRGIGSASDGRSKSIYAPRAEGQERALRRAYADADCSPASVELFEAHATGTAVGDRTELTALDAILREAAGDEARFAAIGSVKSQIGHTKGAAGTASLMKLALSLYQKTLPPTINVERPSGPLADDNTPLYVNTHTRPWVRDPRRPVRRAAASAMGFGGTNFHVVLEEHRAERPATGLLHRTARAWLWHAPDPAALRAALAAGEPPTDGLIPADHARVGFVTPAANPDGGAADGADLRRIALEQLAAAPDAEQWTHPAGVYYRRRALPDPRVGALFAGQGSQYLEMGLDAALGVPTVAQALDDANAVFADDDARLAAVMYPPPVLDPQVRQEQESRLRATRYAQPAIGALSAGQFRYLRELGLDCAGYLGHSFGELTALWAAGALDDTEFFRLARARGAAMAPPDPATGGNAGDGNAAGGDPGTMAAVQASREQITEILTDFPDVVVCNNNAPDQVVVGGGTQAVEAVVEELARRGMTGRLLPVSAAFHTRYVAHAVERFAQDLAQARIGAPAAPVYANTAGAAYGPDADANRAVLAGQLLAPVDFVAGVTAMRAAGCNIFVEFGPKQVLAQLTRRILDDAPVTVVSTDGGPLRDGDVVLKQAAVQLAVLGLPLADINRHDATAGAEGDTEQPRRAAMTVTLTGAEYVPQSRRALYQAGLTDGFQVSAVAAAMNGGPAAVATPPAAPAEPVPAPQPALTAAAPAAAELPAVPAVAGSPAAAGRPAGSAPVPAAAALGAGPAGAGVSEAVALHLDLHGRYLDGQLRVTEELVGLLRDGAQNGDQAGWVPAAVEQVRDQSLAAGRAHVHANEVLAALAGLELAAGGHAPAAPAAGAPARVGLAPRSTSAAGPAALAPPPAAPTVPAPVIADAPATVPADSAGPVAVPAQPTGNGHHPHQPGTLIPAAAPLPADVWRVSESMDSLTRHTSSEGAEARPAAGPDEAGVRTALLGVVADRTGYPAEMIDTGMDLEADLGVDSIKRVQILGALQEHFPTLPSAGPETLAEMRTLNHITDYVLTSLAAGAPPAASTPPNSTLNGSPAAAPGVDPDTVRTALLGVVADRTGYPAEMIDTGMDLEADLGVDSIKRVQILGALQEHFPTLPSAGPETLAEMRTLNHITDYVLTSLGPVNPAPDGAPNGTSPKGDQPKGGEPTGTAGLNGHHAAGHGDDAVLPHRPVELVPAAPVDILGATPFGADPVAVLIDATGHDAPAPELTALADGLTARGFAVRTVRLPGHGGTAGDGAEQADPLDGWDAAEVEQALAGALGGDGAVDLCALLIAANGGDGAWAAGIRRLADTVLVAKHAAGPLSRAAARGGRAAFCAVTRLDGGLGLRGDAPAVERLVGGAAGVVKTLLREEPALFCRALDLHPAHAPAAVAELVLTELWDAATDLAEVGLDATGARWTVRPGPFGDRAAQAEDREAGTGATLPVLGPDDIIVVTGGARGVTADCVRALAARTRARFVLLGRTAADSDPEWATGVADGGLLAAAAAALAAQAGPGGPRPTPRQAEAARRDVLARREIRDTLAALTAAGSDAEYLAVDIADRDAVRAALEPYRGRAAALVHGAGALADSALTAKTPDAVRRVLTPKLTGLRNVLDALGDGPGSPLRHLVLFASVAGLMGNPGQADYAAANEALGRLAAGWKHADRGRHVTAIDWGAWDGGMVDADLRELFRSRGVALIDRTAGAEAFAEQFEPARVDDVCVLVGSAEALTGGSDVRPAPALVARRELREIAEHPVIRDHQVGGFPVLPATFGLGWLVNVVERAHPGLTVVEARGFDVHKGVVFDGTGELAFQVHTAAAEREGAGTGGRVVVKASVRSPGALPAGLSRYAATLVLAAAPPAPAEVEDWPRLEAEWTAPGPEDGLEIYTGATLFHGPLLQGIRRIVARGDDRLVVECRLDGAEVGRGAFAGALHDPVLADLLLHGPSVLGRWLTGQACLPLAVGRIDYRAPLPAGEPFAVVIDGAVVRDTGVTNRVTAVGRDGRILVRLHDVAMVGTPDMAAKFAEGTASWHKKEVSA